MSTKREVLMMANRGEGCLGKAADDEPVFVLRAQDLLSVSLVYRWADELAGYAVRRGIPIPDKVKLAQEDALKMSAWQAANPVRVKMPD
jgi:hypothetical protein